MSQSFESACVVGASGLVGRELVLQLLAEPGVSRVTTLVRRSSGQVHEKLDERVIDFERPEGWQALVQGDVLFSALGTTLKTAGSKQAQYRVDHDYQLFAARAAQHNGASCAVLVSATGADPGSRIFYSRMKGELEQAVVELGFARTRILRPGFLDGEREEYRLGERLALPLARALPAWPSLAPVRPIQASVVARAAIQAAGDEAPGVRFLEAKDLFEWGAR